MDVAVATYRVQLGGQEFRLLLSHRFPHQADVSPWCWRLRCPPCGHWYEIDLKILGGDAYFTCPECQFGGQVDFAEAIA